MRIALAVMLSLFGTTFWWMSSFMTGQTTAPRHWSWTLINVLVVLTVLGCTATAWAIFRSHGWWTIAAVVAGVMGLLAVGVFVLPQRTLEIGLQDLGVQINLWMHLIGAIAVIVLACLPALQTWVAEAP